MNMYPLSVSAYDLAQKAISNMLLGEIQKSIVYFHEIFDGKEYEQAGWDWWAMYVTMSAYGGNPP
jgi:hypothetical protein